MRGAELAEVARQEVAARPDLVPVALERATAGQGLADYSGDLFHPSDEGYARYVTAFRAAIAESDPQPFVPDAG